MDHDYPLIAIGGPTGSGKSALALHLAEKLEGEIVNYDSLQLYRYFDIGAAKLSEAERMGIPHHLLDVLEPPEITSAGWFVGRARVAIDAIRKRDKLPILVGGTGFYLRALLVGLFEGPQRDAPLRERFSRAESRRPGILYRCLRRMDRPAASRIHPNDTNKLIRALEICWASGRSLSEWHGQQTAGLTGYRVRKLALDPPRQELFQRLDERARRMFATGLLEEVGNLLTLGVPSTAKPFESLGYRQALAVIEGRMELEEAIQLTARDTRRYAKRQWTWFRKEPEAEWLAGFGDDPVVQRKALDFARQ